MTTAGPSNGAEWLRYAAHIRGQLHPDRPAAENKMIERLLRQIRVAAQLADRLRDLPEPPEYAQYMVERYKFRPRTWEQHLALIARPREERYWPKFPIFPTHTMYGHTITSASAVASEISRMRNIIWDMHRTLGHTECADWFPIYH